LRKLLHRFLLREKYSHFSFDRAPFLVSQLSVSHSEDLLGFWKFPAAQQRGPVA
jgi:hypothetical protein